ncbi:MAG: ROK family protein [Eubacteriales bacterium]
MDPVCCFDVGGTAIKTGVIDSQGRLLFQESIPTPQNLGAEGIVTAICKEVEKIRNLENFSAISVSTAGIVEPKEGKILYANERIPHYTGCQLSDTITQRTALPCYVENDVKAAALGEMWKGSGQNLDHFLCLTIGTGIGLAIVTEGKIYRGNSQLACYGGEMLMGTDKYENFASTFSLLALYQKECGKHYSGKEFFLHLSQEQPLAKKLFTEYIGHLVTGILNFVYLFDPGTVLLGGGISEKNETLLCSVREEFYKRAIPIFAENTKINLTSLGNLAGLYGAAAIYYEKENDDFV